MFLHFQGTFDLDFPDIQLLRGHFAIIIIISKVNRYFGNYSGTTAAEEWRCSGAASPPHYTSDHLAD
jgi:hypothetical protein